MPVFGTGELTPLADCQKTMDRRVMYGEPDCPRPGSKAPDYGGSLFPNVGAVIVLSLIMFVLFLPSWS